MKKFQPCFLAVLSVFFSTSSQAAIEKTIAVVVGKPVKSTELFEVLSYPARVVSKINTTVLAEIDGVVTRIHAPLGQSVTRRQKLLTISHTDPVYQYAPVMISSPISGVVSGVEVNEGTQVSRGQRLASVTDPSQLRITLELPANDLKSVRKGLAGEFRISGSETPLAVTVRGVSPFVDPATGTALAELEVKEPKALAPGLIGRVTLKINSRHGIAIPEYAIVYKEEKTFVRRFDQGKARQVAVTLGRKQQGMVEVLSGLKETEILIERTSRFVADGEEVKLEGGDAK